MLMNQGVGKDVSILFKEDLRREDVQICLRTIKEKNELLGVSLEQYMKLENGNGIRKDVLMFFSENIHSISTNQDIVYNLVSFFEKTDVNPEWYEWINRYCDQNDSFSVDDFMTLLQEAMDKNIPLYKVKDIFSDGKEDIFSIYESIEEYVEEKWIEGESREEETLPYQFCGDQNKSAMTDKYLENEVDYTGMFGGLLSVVTDTREDMTELIPVQEHFNGYALSLQNFINDISNFSGRVVNEWQNDRKENARLKSLYKMQQKILEDQQNKITEMREEIFRLKAVIEDYEKAALHQAAMNRKIDELHSLTGKTAFVEVGSGKY